MTVISSAPTSEKNSALAAVCNSGQHFLAHTPCAGQIMTRLGSSAAAGSIELFKNKFKLRSFISLGLQVCK